MLKRTRVIHGHWPYAREGPKKGYKCCGQNTLQAKRKNYANKKNCPLSDF